ncbi:hypothetical protein [Roseovarius litoreus]|uniref:hypothetical protein n=1 Tax=Roseovarius litoreus TaxID=1155722 RepID=UPI00122D3857|nr:hypothetical protein [Roseovarius litoreus]
MIDPEEINRDVAQLETLLRERLGIRGATFAKQLRRAGRRLPRFARRAGHVITQSQQMMQHPRLAAQVDRAAVDHAIGILRAHLTGIDPVQRRMRTFLGLVGVIIFNLLILLTLVVLVLRWRGLI